MPEMPELEALTAFLSERTRGLRVERILLASISALKTVTPSLSALHGARIDAVRRRGKYVVLSARDETAAAEIHLVFHLAKAGWLRWYDAVPQTVVRPGRSPLALRAVLEDQSGFDLTEAGTKKSLAVWVVHDPAEIPGIARLGPDPLSPDFTVGTLTAILAGRRTQIKGLLRDQAIIAGIGNAYSDEILHAARMSPYALAANLGDEEISTLYDAIRNTITEAAGVASGRPPAELKDAKRRTMRVHGRRGQPCPVCGDTVRSVFFADRSLEYCARCQTGGKPLADRRLSRLLT